jgi:Acyl-CoA synthetases (AMP-forming)/AMP-acid ligases II
MIGRMIRLVKIILRGLLRLLYRVEVSGLENYHKAGQRVLIIANHTSLLDGVLLYAWLPETPTFAINSDIAQRPVFKPFLKFVDLFLLNPINPYSIKSMIKFIKQDHRAVIFPEGRITVTGSLMKVYEGPGLIADKTYAMILPIAIDGAQFSPFSYMKGRGRTVFFPRIRMTVLPPVTIRIAADLNGHDRRKSAALHMQDLMYRLAYTNINQRTSLFETFLHSMNLFGRNTVILEDINRQPLTYKKLLLRSIILGHLLGKFTGREKYTGVLLPNIINTVVTFLALQYSGRVPAMLNYSQGTQSLLQACQTGRIKTIISSRKFIETANLQALATVLSQQINLVYLEDMADSITPMDRFMGLIRSWHIHRHHRRMAGNIEPDQPALLLFTSGSEGMPKGVLLSHHNLLSNFAQVHCHINYNIRDTIFTCLPLFHSFGLNGGCLMPLFSGCKIFLYPTPLHYRLVPELIYELGATILFSTNTFLKGYARYANSYDFNTLRYTVAGAEKLTEDTSKLWMEKFGIRILQGYGVTECSPVISVNTPMASKPGSVGRPMTDIECYLEPAEGIERGGRLVVKGPNVMLGYLLHDHNELKAPATSRGPGWYDTGDIADIDAEGFITILGRVKRFAKVGGEMISLTAVEDMALYAWPGSTHAAINLPDPKKGERIILFTNRRAAARKDLQEYSRQHGIGELCIPRQVIYMRKLPLLRSGKIDYQALTELAQVEGNPVDDGIIV